MADFWIRMLRDERGAENGIGIRMYRKGEVYNLPNCGPLFVEMGAAQRYYPDQKAAAPAAENKALGPAAENKAEVPGDDSESGDQDVDWTAPWFTIRARIKELTGEMPKSKADAERIARDRGLI